MRQENNGRPRYTGVLLYVLTVGKLGPMSQENGAGYLDRKTLDIEFTHT